jgi:hypothetical protein
MLKGERHERKGQRGETERVKRQGTGGRKDPGRIVRSGRQWKGKGEKEMEKPRDGRKEVRKERT